FHKIVLEIIFGLELNKTGRSEIALVCEIRTFIKIYLINQFRDGPVEVCITLSVRMTYHIHRQSVHSNIDIRSMINIKSPEKNLFRFSAACMLRNKQPGHHT